MKKLLLIIAAIMLSINISAQTTLTQAVDFTATDCHGTEVNLFDILDGGQYVLIDFFYTTCGPCNSACPFIVEAYTAFGCNQNEVFFMEISPTDGDAACQAWCNTYGVEYPTIGTSGGGASICNTYHIPAYPTVILIKPDRQIVIQDLYPIPNAQTIINQLTPHGIQEHECGGTVVDPAVEIALGEVGTTSFGATFTPNETCVSYSILAGIDAEMQNWVNMMGMPLEQLVFDWGINYTATESYTWTDMLPNTEYTIYAVPMDADGNFYELQTVIAQTQPLGGTGTAIIELAVSDITATSVVTTATPNAETAEYHYGLITKELYNEIGADSAVQIFRTDPYVFYTADVWTWFDLQPETEYYVLSTGMNANGEWGETTLLEFNTLYDAVGTIDAVNVNVYPNPANDFIKISGTDIDMIDVYNSLGQKINTLTINGNEAMISTSSLDNGVYFAKINGSIVKRFIVKH